MTHRPGVDEAGDRAMAEGTGPDVTERTGHHALAGPVQPRRGWTRRRVLVAGLAPAVLAGAGIAGVGLVSRGVLPGRAMLFKLDGACSVASPQLVYSPPGPSLPVCSTPRPPSATASVTTSPAAKAEAEA